MKGKDWKFQKHLPDIDDMDACSIACDAFLALNYAHPCGANEVDYFRAGFMRGIEWHKDKEKRCGNCAFAGPEPICEFAGEITEDYYCEHYEAQVKK